MLTEIFCSLFLLLSRFGWESWDARERLVWACGVYCQVVVHFTMLRALYNFSAINEKTLGFGAGDLLLFLEPHARDKNWLRVADANGRVGFAPINFIEVYAQTTSEGLLAFLDEGIRRGRRDRDRGGTVDLLISVRQNILTSPYTTEEHLAQITREVGELQAKAISELSHSVVDPGLVNKKPPQQPQHPHSAGRSPGRRSNKAGGKRLPEPYLLPMEGIYQPGGPDPFLPAPKREELLGEYVAPSALAYYGNNAETVPAAPQEEVFNESLVGAELVDVVRNATGLSHKLSQDAAEAVLNFVMVRMRWEKVSQLLGHLERTPRVVSHEKGVIAKSVDAKNIRTIFSRLTRCKEDEQQRSWALHEDEGMILEDLERLDRILNDTDPSISQYVMAADQYRSVSELVLYYQMETRWSIRTKLIDCFTVICCIDQNAHSVLLNSILPLELARELRASGDNAQRMRLCADLLVILLSSRESIPTTHFDFLDTMFLEFLFEMIENPPNQEEKITDCLMNLLFAYNLQFHSENMIISTLEKKQNANVFTQKMIYFLNRGVDPIHIAGQPLNLPNSVLKLTTDTFSSKAAADLFYTNDIKVLIDIVTRCVTDLGPGDKSRTAYLKLIQVIVRNTNFAEHKHRYEDLVHCFTSILQEEDDVSARDQDIIAEIATEFPRLFGADLSTQ